MEITGAVLERMEMPAPYGKSRPISVCQLELDEPQEDELLVRITASGICHSDLSVVNGVRPPSCGLGWPPSLTFKGVMSWSPPGTRGMSRI